MNVIVWGGGRLKTLLMKIRELVGVAQVLRATVQKPVLMVLFHSCSFLMASLEWVAGAHHHKRCGPSPDKPRSRYPAMPARCWNHHHRKPRVSTGFVNIPTPQHIHISHPLYLVYSICMYLSLSMIRTELLVLHYSDGQLPTFRWFPKHGHFPWLCWVGRPFLIWWVLTAGGRWARPAPTHCHRGRAWWFDRTLQRRQFQNWGKGTDAIWLWT